METALVAYRNGHRTFHNTLLALCYDRPLKAAAISDAIRAVEVH